MSAADYDENFDKKGKIRWFPGGIFRERIFQGTIFREELFQDPCWQSRLNKFRKNKLLFVSFPVN